MTYHLNEAERNQLRIWSLQIPAHYSESDALRLCALADSALTCGCLEDETLYELLERLPRIIPEKNEEPDETQKEDSDWEDCIDERWEQYRREADRLHQMLSNMVFLQSAVYQKNLAPVGKPLDKAPSLRQGKSIKQLR